MDESVSFRLPRPKRWISFACFVLALTGIPIGVAVLEWKLQLPVETLIGAVLQEWIEGITAEPVAATAYGLLAVTAVVFDHFLYRYQHRARLVLSPDGIALHSGLPRLFAAWLERQWPVRWSTLQRVVLSGTVIQPRLTFHSRGGHSVSVDPEQWHPRDATPETPIFRRSRRRSLQSLVDKDDGPPLLRALQALGVNVEIEQPKPTIAEQGTPARELIRVSDFVLAGSTFLALGGYALVDGYLAPPYAYIDGPPWWLMAATGVSMTMASGSILLLRHRLLKADVAAIAGFLGLASALAACPAGLRLNAASDPDGPTTARYVAQPNGTLRPVTPDDAPVFKAPAKLPAGEQQDIVLYRGLLRRWQYEIASMGGNP